MAGTTLKIYRELAAWWTLFSSPDDYAEEAAFFLARLRERCTVAPRSLLELGSGGGNNALHMKHAFAEVVLSDISPDMLDVSRALNPECEHVLGDMRTLRLDRQFDCVFVHDAVVYMTSEGDLRAAIATAFHHCRPGGAALFAPDHLVETFQPSTECGGHDNAEGRGFRYLEWTWDPDAADSTCLVDFVFMLREPGGTVRVESERHTEGLFSRDTWLRLLREAGFTASAVRVDHSELEAGRYEVFVCGVPAAP